MEARKPMALILAALTVILCPAPTAEACSCMPQHAQTSYCKAEYVILARIIRKSSRRINDDDVYKIEIKRSYKMSPTANLQLKDGRLTTPSLDSLCGGLNLKIGKLYLIAGDSPNIGICNYAKEYSQMTIVERRGFAGGYRKGCPCEIKPMFQLEGFHHSIGTCFWKPFTKCESNFGACVPAHGLMTADHRPIKCHWRMSPLYVTCRNQNVNARQ